jgi:hypothetical protein
MWGLLNFAWESTLIDDAFTIDSAGHEAIRFPQSMEAVIFAHGEGASIAAPRTRILLIMSATTTINSKGVERPRTLRFETIDQVLAEGERLADAECRGCLHCMGTWTLGQSLGHLATWAGYAFEPVPFRPPLLVRFVLRPMKWRFLYKPMRRGLRIPRVPGGTFGIDPVPLDEGLSRFRLTFGRLKNEQPTQPHVLFGKMSHDEWINAHLRHAELHLSLMRAD